MGNNQMKRFFGLVVIGSLLLTAFSGCGSSTNNSEKINLAFVAGAATDFWTFAERGVQKADDETDNVTVKFRYTNDGTAVDQRRIIDDLLAKGIQGLAVTPLDPDNQAPLINRVARQVPVVITDSDVPGSKRLCYIGTDNVQAGEKAGELIKELLPDGGEIMLFVGKKDAQNAKERIQGIRNELKGTDIRILDIRTDDLDQVRAKANVNDALTQNPDIDCLVGLWSYNAPAILQAVKDAGKLGEVDIVGFDERNATINGVKDGYIYGTVVQKPFQFGYQAVKVLAKVVQGDSSVVPADQKIIIPIQVIRQDNAEEFLNKIQALRSGDYSSEES